MRVLCHMGAESSRKRLLFSVLVGFERRASNGVKRAFFVVQVKEKRQVVSSGRLNGGVGAWAQAGCSDENDEKSRNN